MKSTTNIDKIEIEFMMKLFGLDETTVREAYEKTHNNISKTIKILMKKQEEKNEDGK